MEKHELTALIIEAMKGAAEACDVLSGFVLQAGNHLRAGEVQDGNKLLIKILDDFSQLISFLSDVSHCKDFTDKLDPNQVRAMEKEFWQVSEVLSTAVEAQENQDWVFLADLLEYEFSEKVGSWNGFFSGLSEVATLPSPGSVTGDM
jgi:hypothetical protein